MTFSYSLLIIECILAIMYEKRKYKTIMAPVTLLSMPYAIVVTLSVFICPRFGFKTILDDEIWVIIAGISSFFIGEILWNLLLRKKPKSFSVAKIQYSDRFILGSIHYMELIVLVILVRYVYIFKSVGVLTYFGTDGYHGIMTGGLYIHLMLSLFPLVPILLEKAIFNKKKNIIVIIFVILFIGEVFLTYTKYHVIMLVIATMLYIISQHPKTTPYVAGALVLIPILLFSLNYLLNFTANGNTLSRDYLTGHLLNYLTGGVNYSTISTTWKNSLDFFEVLGSFVMPFPNLFINLVFGINICPPIDIPYIILSTLGERGNVINFITFVFGSSWLGGFVFFIGLGMIATNIVGKKRENSMLKIYLLTILALSFFSSYLQLVVPWEVFIWSIFINYISKHRFKIGKISSLKSEKVIKG